MFMSIGLLVKREKRERECERVESPGVKNFYFFGKKKEDWERSSREPASDSVVHTFMRNLRHEDF